jgi:hypothetical protein
MAAFGVWFSAMTVEAWANGWQARFNSIIQKMGYEDTFDFVFSRSGQSFGEMFRAIRESAGTGERSFLAFTHLIELFYVDAEHRGQLRTAVMEALVRSLRQRMRGGWNRGKKVRERRIDVQTNWPIPHLVTYRGWSHDDWRDFQSRVLAEIEVIDPADDWCPEGANDPTIQEVFRRTWPEVN